MHPKHLSCLPVLCVAIVAFGFLAACQTVPGAGAVSRSAYVAGAERVADCAAQSCARLNLDGASLADYTALNAMTHVDALMISYTDFSDLGDISGMVQLTELHIGQSQVVDLSGLVAFPNLTLLHAQLLRAQDYSAIGQLTALRELAVGGQMLTDLNFVAALRGLERLHLSHLDAGIDLSGLRGHPALRSIHLDNTGLTDLNVLLRMPRLREVSISDFSSPALEAQIARLRARGITVNLEEPVMVVC